MIHYQRPPARLKRHRVLAERRRDARRSQEAWAAGIHHAILSGHIPRSALKPRPVGLLERLLR